MSRPRKQVHVLGRWEEGIYPKAGASSDDLAQLRRFDELVLKWQQYRDRQGRKAFALPLALGQQGSRSAATGSESPWLTTCFRMASAPNGSTGMWSSIS